MEFYFNCYGELGLQRYMVSDRARTDAFASAISELINGGERVLDVGTGTGLLAMLAAKAGAEKVIGIDQASIAQLAEALIERNGLSDKIEIINANAKKLRLSEPVDILISEWLGHFAFAETMLDDVLVARDNNLKVGGAMLPSGVTLMLAPVCDPELYEDYGPGFWKNPVHGLDYSLLESLELKQGMSRKFDVPEDSLLAAGQPLYSLDLNVATKEDQWQEGEVEFTIQSYGMLDGFVGWFVAQLSPTVILDTGPEAPLTHWEQTHFPFTPRVVNEGQVLKVGFSINRHPFEDRSLEVKLSLDGEAFHYTVG